MCIFNVWQSCDSPHQKNDKNYLKNVTGVGINDHNVTCQCAEQMFFPLLSGLVCRWKHKSSDGKLFSMSSLGSLMDPSF